MPAIADKIRTTRKYDRRIKLSDEEREYIKKLYHHEKMSIHGIARLFAKKCSRKLIQFTIFPERLEVMRKRNIENKHHLKYYDKDKWREIQKEHRAYKRKLLKEGKISK